ncbi:hypothetical protein COO60DRAFT_592072 [Scenedesmus sp. NREL 46B-D3]|nr:hypothetical protein COO60DRAFT_592072 [Scenedesmus sp. NREL 46B-D3]
MPCQPRQSMVLAGLPVCVGSANVNVAEHFACYVMLSLLQRARGHLNNTVAQCSRARPWERLEPPFIPQQVNLFRGMELPLDMLPADRTRVVKAQHG